MTHPGHSHTPPQPIPRRTVAGPVSIHGVTLFTAQPGAIRILPSEGARPGVFFVQSGTDAASNTAPLAAHISSLASEARRTVLKHAAFSVQTVEHLLSALWGLGITDATVEINGPEIPVGDGSARLFIDAIRAQSGSPACESGARALASGAACEPLIITRRIEIVDENNPATDGTDGRARIIAEPLDPGALTHAPALELRYDLDYRPEFTGIRLAQSHTYRHVWRVAGVGEYERSIAPARTFCTFAEAHALRQAGLFTHLSPKDMLVLGPDARPIDNTLRFDDEPARHKVLDMLGDLSLVGQHRPIIGRVHAIRTGHAHNHRMAAALLQTFN